MDCQTCREALSARLDGEAEPVPAAETDAHLAQCTACLRWQASAQALTRSIRVRPAVAHPDLVGAVPMVVPPRRAALVPRPALAAVAVVQLWLAMDQVLAGTGAEHVGHGVSAHLFNEGAAWNLALGIGLLVAAVNARRAAGLLPTLGGFVAVLLGFSVNDLLNGTATAARVASHLPLVAGLVLLYLVARAHRGQPTPGTPAERDQARRGGSGGVVLPPPDRRRERSRPLHPTAHRRAA
ncbi:putative anti-sigma-YlaC factor YlaD [Saccharothrix coeruleofusca]|uniref:zf-HC2 domain-containing protein n=1 Tax=Saccharothrix coeruleofusca TaxID=33919 RepID=UPI001AE6E5C0|nr:zf-HC2 domain-containing protein [Saccharothrix coeruleofusca]MBP2335575.1 putative anti-sigma-YlaC factor YlaD [Saccharothrix coeruleofusca]